MNDPQGLGRRRPRMRAAAEAAADPAVRPWNKPEPPTLDKQRPPLGAHPRAPGECEWCGAQVRHLAAHKRSCSAKPFP